MNMNKQKTFFSPLVGMFLVALCALFIRIAFIAFYHANPLAGGDPQAFWTFAEGVAAGQGFRSTFEPWLADRPPLYSYFLAIIFLCGGKTQLVVFVVQAVLASMASAVFYLCANRLLGWRGGLFSGLLFAVYPAILMFTQQILAEAIYIPIWVFLLACLLFANEQERRWLIPVAGLFLGLLALVRREAILPGGLLAVLLLWLQNPTSLKKLIQQVTVVFLVTILVITPWLARNAMVLGKPILSSSGGVNFMVGNNPLADGGYTPPPTEWQDQFVSLGELERDQKARQLSLEWVRENPADFVKLLPQKFLKLWGLAHNRLLDMADIILLFLCLAGFGRLLQRRENWKQVFAISIVPVLTTTLVGLAFVGLWRYRQISYPGLILLAGYGMVQILAWINASRSRRRGLTDAYSS